jgi:3-isopropylmalate/(R)-2-methylmalate dehydratase small subunit
MSFYTSLTGLNAATAQLGVTANNVANVSTVGFKRSRADFGDIFYLNSIKTGLLPVQLDLAVCVRLREQLHAQPGAHVRVDLPAQTVTGPDGVVHAFAMDAFRKKCLVEGLDEIGVTLHHDAALKQFEVQYRQAHPWLFNL